MEVQTEDNRITCLEQHRLEHNIDIAGDFWQKKTYQNNLTKIENNLTKKQFSHN